MKSKVGMKMKVKRVKRTKRDARKKKKRYVPKKKIKKRGVYV